MASATLTYSAPWVDTDEKVHLNVDPAVCSHGTAAQAIAPTTRGCEECLKAGDGWVHLRECLTCGHVGCCDSSPNRHARKHAHAEEHPVIRSIMPGEEWGWCYIDGVYLNK